MSAPIAQLVETHHPFVEVFTTIDEELQVVQSSRRLVEGCSGVPAVADKPENEADGQILYDDVSELPVVRRVVIPLLQPKQFAVPSRASNRITVCDFLIAVGGSAR